MTLRHHLCRLCGARDDSLGIYETCRWDGPYHEWRPAGPITFRRLLWMRLEHWTSTWYARTDLLPHETELSLEARLGVMWLGPIEVLVEKPSPAPGTGTLID